MQGSSVAPSYYERWVYDYMYLHKLLLQTAVIVDIPWQCMVTSSLDIFYTIFQFGVQQDIYQLDCRKLLQISQQI